MNLRTTFAIAFAVVAVAVAALVGLFSYRTIEQRLGAEVDRSLVNTAGQVVAGDTTSVAPAPPVHDRDGHAGHDTSNMVFAQYIATDGTVTPVRGSAGGLPVAAADRAFAANGFARQTCLRTLDAGGSQYRVLTEALGGGRGAVQVARNLNETNRVLDSVAAGITAVGGIVLLVAAGIGWLIARQITRRLQRLTKLAEQVRSTGRLDIEVPTSGRDEVGRLSSSFDAMLGRLANARDDQQRLIQDAGHELRTPLTSLRTNVSVLRRFEELTPLARARLLDDLDGETRELTDLVNELVELATQQRDDEQAQPVELAEVAEVAAVRARRRYGREITIDADTGTVLGRRQGLERALSNLLDNAAKFDIDGTEPIEVRIGPGRIEVRDRGPGIADEDAQRVFDRFYRATTARSLPGSGLGLAIVREVARAHGGDVFLAPRPGGGAVVGFTLAASSYQTPNSAMRGTQPEP
jgi:two-component system sensor histidine kinase MprB